MSKEIVHVSHYVVRVGKPSIIDVMKPYVALYSETQKLLVKLIREYTDALYEGMPKEGIDNETEYTWKIQGKDPYDEE